MLFAIYHFDYNDRDEIARFKAKTFEDVQAYLLKNFIKEGQQDKIGETDFGLEWDENYPDECRKQRAIDEDKELDEDENPCDMCDGCTAGFEIDEIEEPEDDEFEFRTIYGTNEYYDLTKLKEWCDNCETIFCPDRYNAMIDIKCPLDYNPDDIAKADDWDKTLSGAWRKSPEHGIAALLLNPITPQEGLSKELIESSKKKLAELDNIPCKKCGRTDLPLHYNYLCPNCFNPKDEEELK